MKDLLDRLAAANEAYRNGTPTMTDATYDVLEDQLRVLDPNHAWFSQTGAPAPVGGSWPKVKHTIPMRSLNKAQTGEDIRAWWPGALCFVTEKLDGISVALTYTGGKLVQALTRGDGVVGEDITRNVLLMKCVPHQITDPDLIQVRAEIVVTRPDFAEHFPGESNTRNTAAGTAKRQSDPDKCRHLSVVAYQLFKDGQALLTKRLEIATLVNLGFQPVTWNYASTVEELLDLYQGYIDRDRDENYVDIDGLVVEVDGVSLREGMGEKNSRPAGAIAFKFPHESSPTTLREVVWQVGKSGRVTPVAIFDEVTLAGAKVKRASLHNLDQIASLLEGTGQDVLAAGDRILVSRRNDVIPYIESVIEATEDAFATEFSPPAACPSCSCVLSRDGAYLVCMNTMLCPAQVSGSIKRWISKIGVKFLGDTLIDALCDQGHLATIADLYSVDPKMVATLEMNGRSIGGSADRGFASLRENMDLPLHVFVGALGIPQIGRSMAKIIIDGGYHSLHDLWGADPEALARIDGVGESKAFSFHTGFHHLMAEDGVIKGLLLAGVTIQAPATGALQGMSVCMSGFRDPSMASAIEAQGGTIKGSVGKGLTYLVVKDPSSTSGKPEKARQLGVKVIGIDEMRTILG